MFRDTFRDTDTYIISRARRSAAIGAAAAVAVLSVPIFDAAADLAPDPAPTFTEGEDPDMNVIEGLELTPTEPPEAVEATTVER